MRDPYSAYATVYDRIGQTRFGEGMAKITTDWLSRHDVHPASVLDLAAGTGAAALEFARKGMRVAGIDQSPDMLDQARSKAAEFGMRVEFSLGDMRQFSIDAPVELVTSFFDSFNYLLTDQDLRDAFSAVNHSLAPDGWFIFDLNTLDRYNSAWNNATEIAWQDDHLLVIYRSTFDPATGISPLLLTTFERIDPERDLWRRWDETHVERGYRLADVEAFLTESGFEVVSVEQLDERTMHLDGPATERSARAVFFARKPSTFSERVE